MTRAPQTCSAPGCPHERGHCPTHKPQRSPSSKVTGTRRWREQTKPLILKPGTRCHYCPRPAITVDHARAVSNGGAAHDPANLVPSCRDCNARKGAQ